ncbi:hypothetical protein DRO56_03835 [Candidatus Bathyarchaeota archaeon]|nr:MAG: hypothetical protein DRO56_03835 [Candidatus Bathyarchaeota archaeon]
MRSQRYLTVNILLVEPDYYTRYPPLGLLKIAAYHRIQGDRVRLVRGCVKVRPKPDRVYVTSLFTWAWRPVWKAVRYYKGIFPEVEVWLGGLYATLMPDHARKSGADVVYEGLFKEAEDLMPAYDLVPEWDGSIVFASRGCNRRCPYCAVWRIEGSINSCKRSIKHLVWPRHTRIILWDNNILQSPYWREIFEELIWFSTVKGMKIDFNQGLDARLITEEVAELLSKMKLLCVRISYDHLSMRRYVKRAIELLASHGIRRRSILVYMLYNFQDTPDNLFERMRDILHWGAVAYPMRYEPLNALERWKHVAPGWDAERLERVEDFRRVYGYGGTFPPYRWLVKRFEKAKCFDEAFKLPKPGEHAKRVRKPYHASWQRERDWRQVVERFLAKRW